MKSTHNRYDSVRWSRYLIGALVFFIVIGVALHFYLNDSEPPSHPESNSPNFDHAVVDWIWSGAVTAESAVVKARLPASNSVRLAVQDSPNLDAPRYFDATRVADEDAIALFSLTELAPDTQYTYALEIDGTLDRATEGQFATFGEGVYSFSFALSACASTGSNGIVFDTIRSHDPLFFLHLGDLHYENIIRNDPATFHAAYNRVLTAPAQAHLYRSIPIVYVWDDHDFGANNSSSASPSAQAARQAYEEAVPHYPLTRDEGQGAINQTFTVGRVRFIITDARSQRDRGRKTMLGASQKDWLKQQLLQARDEYALIVWVNSVPWIGEAPKFSFVPEDNWSGYPEERREISDFLVRHEISNLIMLSGDAHMLAFDDGSNTNYSADASGPGFPILHAAALDRQGSIKGGPYTLEPISGGGQFGLISFKDTGHELQVQLAGYDYVNRRLMELKFDVVSDGIRNLTVVE